MLLEVGRSYKVVDHQEMNCGSYKWPVAGGWKVLQHCRIGARFRSLVCLLLLDSTRLLLASLCK